MENAFFFATFNALSFQIILGSPMVLYAKSLGATATILGIISGMMPLLVIFQIPAANYIPRLGFKRFVVGGWSTRVGFIFAIALVPITAAFLNATSRLGMILFLLFMFNLSRGISSCAWLPWLTALIPGTIRGKYLAREQACIGVASCLAFVIAALCLGETPWPWQFSVLFIISGTMGAISLVYLKRIPDARVPDETRTSRTPVPWLELARFPPFKKLLITNLGWSAAYGGISTFTVSFLKTEVGMTEGKILYIVSVFFLGGLVSLWFGTHMDRLGSRPVVRLSCWLWIAIMVNWILLSATVVRPAVILILVLEFFMGMGAALFNMANTRLAMVISPPMGKNHFFALYSVVINVSLGLSPVVWGLFIDLSRHFEHRLHGFVLSRFSYFFMATAAAFALTVSLARRLEESSEKIVSNLWLAHYPAEREQ